MKTNKFTCNEWPLQFMPKAHAVTRREFARTRACAARGRVIALSVSMSVCLFETVSDADSNRMFVCLFVFFCCFFCLLFVCGQRSLGKIGTFAQPFIGYK